MIRLILVNIFTTMKSGEILTHVLYLKDLLLFPLYFLIVWYFIKRHVSKSKDPITQKHMLKAFYLKVIGMIVYALLLEFFFKSGDSMLYFTGISNVYDTFYSNFNTGLELIFNSPQNFSSMAGDVAHPMFFFTFGETLNVVKLTAPLSLICFNSYLVISLFLALFTFLGFWYLFQVCIKYFPENNRANFIICFCLPTVLIWSSGILKDSYSIGGFGFCTYYMDKIFLEKKFKIRYLIPLLISSYLIYLTKGYTLYALLVSFMVGYLSQYKIKNTILKFAIIFILFPLTIIILINLFKTEIQDRIVKSVIEDTIEKQKLWENQGGSTYDLGTMDPSFSGIITLMPKGINVTLFRPYLWEASSLFVVLEAMQALFCFIILIFTFLKFGILKFFKTIFSNPFLISLFLYTIVFSFFVGINTGNFGSLSRYKIPSLITFFIVIFNARYLLRLKKNQNYPIASI